MYVNIALIKEVHEHLATPLAQKEASDYLKKIGLDDIGLKRVSECGNLEIFYVMFIRALMSKEMTVIIISPFLITTNVGDMKSIINNLSILNSEKNILILDLDSNKIDYKDCLCNIIE